MTTGKCHWSFPANENKNSERATCRTLPDSYIVDDDDWANWEFGGKGQSLKMKGQCENCEGDAEGFWKDGKCWWSYPKNASQAEKKAKGMYRCMPKNQWECTPLDSFC